MVYLFMQSGTAWIQQVKLMASDSAAGDNFGRRVPLESGTLVVGTWDISSDSGAYVYSQVGTSWTK